MIMEPKTCTVDGCEQPQKKRKMCGACYLRQWRASRSTVPCAVDGCDRPRDTRDGLCGACNLRRRRASRPAVPCAVDGCERPRDVLDMCGYCYNRQRLANKPYVPCVVEGCARPQETRKLCRNCYQRGARLNLHGVPLPLTQGVCGEPNCERPQFADGRCFTCFALARKESKGLIRRNAGTCIVAGCEKPQKSRNMCEYCYARSREEQKRGRPIPRRGRNKGTCIRPGCDRPQRRIQLCGRCHQGMLRERKRAGAPLKRLPRVPLGSMWITPAGYVIEKVAEPNGWMRQHRYVMEGLIGRRLLPDETVHHRNGARADNRPENLELWASKHPPGQRVEDLLSWAREIINRYDNLVDLLPSRSPGVVSPHVTPTPPRSAARQIAPKQDNRRRMAVGATFTHNGYVVEKVAEPNVWMRQHRYVMESIIGRRLLPDETVHHRNGVRADNRPENLELWASKHPPGQRVEDLLSWAREIVNRYGDLVDLLP